MINIQRTHSFSSQKFFLAVILVLLSFFSYLRLHAAGEYTEVNTDPYEPTKINEFTGAPTRVVWIQDGNDEPAVDAERPTLRLMGLDSEDGGGERPILSDLAAYIKPLITSDGTRVVFGNQLKKTVSVVNWDGTGLKVLLENADFADVWTDPLTGIEWVYAHVQEDRGGKQVPVIRRYRMDDPKIDELVWDKMPMFMFTLAGDGRAASGGGNGGNSPQGFLTLPNGNFTQRAGGCWPSIAPDNSYRMWVFTGNHRSIHFYVPTSRTGIKAKHSGIQFDESPGLTLGGREEVHRVRWSNNTRFMVCSSPFSQWDFKGEVKIPDEVADKIEIYIGKFSEDMTKLDTWMRVTSNDKGDYWADVWIKPGEGEQAVAMDVSDMADEKESSKELNKSELVYTWETGAVGNQIEDAETGSIRQCIAQLKGYATFGLYHVMDLTGGWAEANDAAESLLKASQKNNAFTLEAIVTLQRESAEDQVILLSGASLESAQAALFQRDSHLYFRMNGSEFKLGQVELNVPHHVMVSMDGNTGKLLCTINGKKVMLKGAPSIDFSEWQVAPLIFGAQPDGSKNWSGLLEGIRVLARSVDRKEAQQRYLTQKERRQDREPLEPVVVEAKLLIRSEAAKPKEIAPYRRCLNVNLYQVQRVVNGELEDQKIAVAQWSVLDAKVIPEYEAIKEGSVQTLAIEPWERHPEQDSERKIEGEFFDDVKLYYDVSTLGEKELPASNEKIASGSVDSRGGLKLESALNLQVSEKVLTLPLDSAEAFDANGQDFHLEGETLAVHLKGAIKLSGDAQGSVAAVTVLDGGLDYSRRPDIKFTGSGQGAMAEAGMELASIQLTRLGEGYTDVPTVKVSEPDIQGGRQATAEARFDKKSGALSSIRISDPGSGYMEQPTITIEGGEGKGAKAETYLSVSEIYVTQGGAGYSVPPSVELINGDGQGARARAALQSTVLKGTNDNADIQFINEGALEQTGSRILIDWSGSAAQPGKRQFINQGKWTLKNASLKFISSSGMPTWYGRGNENQGTMKVQDHSWLGFSEFTNTGEMELGSGVILGQAEFARSKNTLLNQGQGVIRVTGGTVENPVVFGINSLISNGERTVHNGSEKETSTALWVVGDGKNPAAFRITGGQVEFYNGEGAQLDIMPQGALLLESNDAGARHQFERRRARVSNHGVMRMAGELYIRSNHSSYGGIENFNQLLFAGNQAKLVRLQNSVGQGGLYKIPDYTSLIGNHPGAEVKGSGTFTYVDQTGEEKAQYMRLLNQGILEPIGTWTLDKVNVYFGLSIPGDDGHEKGSPKTGPGGMLAIRADEKGNLGALVLKGQNDHGHLVLTKGTGSILNILSDSAITPSGTHRIVTAVAVDGEFDSLQFNGKAQVPYRVNYLPDGIEVVFP